MRRQLSCRKGHSSSCRQGHRRILHCIPGFRFRIQARSHRNWRRIGLLRRYQPRNSIGSWACHRFSRDSRHSPGSPRPHCTRRHCCRTWRRNQPDMSRGIHWIRTLRRRRSQPGEDPFHSPADNCWPSRHHCIYRRRKPACRQRHCLNPGTVPTPGWQKALRQIQILQTWFALFFRSIACPRRVLTEYSRRPVGCHRLEDQVR